MIVAWLLLAWLLLPIPFAIVVGTGIKRGMSRPARATHVSITNRITEQLAA